MTSVHRRALTAALRVLAFASALAAALPAFGAEPTPVTLDLMIVYTPGAEARYGGPSGLATRLNHLVNVTNDIHQTSQTGMRVRLVHSEKRNYSDSVTSSQALSEFSSNLGVFAGVETVRKQVGADMVVLMRPAVGDGWCGYAWIGGTPSTPGDLTGSRRWAYSHVSIDCSDPTLAHELGHNEGLRHSRRQDGQGSTFPWALGHGVDGNFVTVMAYGSVFGASRISLFSNPSLSCNGLPCGVARSNTQDGADAVYSLQYVRQQVADYYAVSGEPPPPGDPPPDDPPPITDMVALTSPVREGGMLAQGEETFITWDFGGDVQYVDLSFRIEKKKSGKRWKKRPWQEIQTHDLNGVHNWTVPEGIGDRRRWSRVRFLLNGYDASGQLVASQVSPFVKLKKKRKAH